MVEVEKMNTVMGVTMRFEMNSLSDLADRLSEGLPKIALRNTARRIFDSPPKCNELMYRIVPEATYKRRTRLTATRVSARSDWPGSSHRQKWSGTIGQRRSSGFLLLTRN